MEADVKKYCGSTYKWKETGYILQDGTRLDLSGKNEGARGGSDKHLDLRVQTEYVGAKKERILATPIDAKASSIRPKRNSGTDSSTSIIRNNSEKSTENAKKR